MSIVVLTLALGSMLTMANVMQRAGRWSRAASRNWMVGSAAVYLVVVLLLVTRFGRG